MTLPARKVSSSATNVHTATAICSLLTFHTHVARHRNRNDSSSRVPVTARPYAEASPTELWNADTRMTTPMKRIQLIEPM